MKKINRFGSFLMAAVMLFTTFGTANAAGLSNVGEDSMDVVETFDVSDTLRLEMRVSAQPSGQAAANAQGVQSSDMGSGRPFEIKQLENGEVVQIVSGTVGGEYLTITNYEGGQVASVEKLRVSDRVKKANGDVAPETGVGSVNAGAVGDDGILGFGPGPNQDHLEGDGTLPLATVTYNTSTQVTDVRRVEVYSTLKNTDYEVYTVNGAASDTLSIVVGALFSVISVFLPAQTVVQQIVIAIVTALGGSIAGGAIGVAISEDVAVKACYYDMWGYFPDNHAYSPVYDGVSKHVLTKDSSYYDEWFYEGYTPENWRDMDSLAETIWMHTFYEWYPGVRSYS